MSMALWGGWELEGAERRSLVGGGLGTFGKGMGWGGQRGAKAREGTGVRGGRGGGWLMWFEDDVHE